MYSSRNKYSSKVRVSQNISTWVNLSGYFPFPAEKWNLCQFIATYEFVQNRIIEVIQINISLGKHCLPLCWGGWRPAVWHTSSVRSYIPAASTSLWCTELIFYHLKPLQGKEILQCCVKKIILTWLTVQSTIIADSFLSSCCILCWILGNYVFLKFVFVETLWRGGKGRNMGPEAGM